jgi:hypothetical protein
MSTKKKSTPATPPDLVVRNLGTMWQIDATSEEGRTWVEERVHIEPLFGNPASFLGDWRPMRDITLGAAADGLAVYMAGR